jgi:integrase
MRKLPSGAAFVARGVEIRRLASGELVFKYDLDIAGRRDHSAIGRESDGMTWRRAQELAGQRRAELRQAAGLAAPPEERGARQSFRDAAAAYLTHEEATGGRNLKRKRMHMRNHLAPYFRDLAIGLLTTERLKAYRQHRALAGASPATVNRELATTGHFLNFCSQAKKWLPKGHCAIPRVAETRKARAVLDDAQREALLASAIEDPNPRLWMFTAFVTMTPMRHSEVLAARYEHLDAESCLLEIPVAKSGSRQQPVPPQLRDLIVAERAKGKTGFIFPSAKSKSGHATRMNAPFRRAVTRAGLDVNAVVPHLGRHSAISRLAAAGVGAHTMQQVSGHRSRQMLDWYVHVYGREAQAAAALLGLDPARKSPDLPPNGPETAAEPPAKPANIVAFSKK